MLSPTVLKRLAWAFMPDTPVLIVPYRLIANSIPLIGNKLPAWVLCEAGGWRDLAGPSVLPAKKKCPPERADRLGDLGT